MSKLEKLTNSQKEALASEVILSHHDQGETIFNQGDDALALYIIKKGDVNVIKDGQLVATVSEGSVFGENALLESDKAKRSASIVAKNEVMCLSLPRQLLLDIFGQDVSAIALTNYTRAAFVTSKTLSGFNRTQKERIMGKMNILNLEPGEVVFEKNRPYTDIVLILEGTLNKVHEDGYVTQELTTEFGATECLEHSPLKLQNSYIAGSKLSIAKISFAQIYSMFGEDLTELFENNKHSHEVLIHEKNQKIIEKVVLDKLIYLKHLGKGSFGAVTLVGCQDNADRYIALKSTPKRMINSSKNYQLLKNEKEILCYVQCPLIITMEVISKEGDYIHLGLDYVDGLPFDDVLMELQFPSEWQTCFYMSQVVLMLEYLHHHGIIYRDLKSENIICGTDGYLKLVDLGTAKFLTQNADGSYERTFSCIGTPQYIAPEAAAIKGYTFTADYWSLGILLYEVAIGEVPFGASGEDPYEICNLIKHSEVEFPEDFVWEDCKDLILQLLNKNPEGRFEGSISKLKAHKWFGQINWDWDKIYNKKILPDYFPPSKISEVSSEEAKQPGYLSSKIQQITSGMVPQRILHKDIPENWDESL